MTAPAPRRPLGRAVALVAVTLVVAGAPSASATRAPAEPGPLAAPPGSDAAARQVVASLPRATAVNDRDGNKLFDDLDAEYATASGERVRVVVSFVDGVSTDQGLRDVAAVAPDADVDRRFTLVPAYAGRLSVAEARRVAALPSVRQVELDREGTRELDTATTSFGAAAVVDDWQTTGSLDGQPDVATTADVTIAVLDTGIDDRHQELAGKLVGWHDIGTGRPAPYDPDGHGTHVASIAAGRGSDPRYRGVAPGAALVGVKIDGGGTTQSNAMAAYEWAVANKAALGIRVVTMSFGFGTATDGTTALERTVDAAWDAGLVCFKSNGNSGPRHGTMTVPAAARGILAVGSLLDVAGVGSKYGFALSEFSSRGPTTDGRVKPDLVAAGESITAARAGTTAGYTTLSGTSMASPFAAGAAALVLAEDPSLTPDAVRDVLLGTAQDWGPPGPDADYGHGRLQVWHAVAATRAAVGRSTAGSQPPQVPLVSSTTQAAGTGTVETTFTVTDTSVPVAVTALGALLVGTVEVRTPTGTLLVPLGTANTGDRHHLVSFRPTALGTYSVRVTAPPTTSVTVDVSHSTAPVS